MALTEAQKKATAKYNAKAYDRIEVKTPKGKKNIILDHARSQGQSLNGYINQAIDEKMARDKDKDKE